MAEKLIRTPFPIVSVEKSGFKETYGGAEDIVTVFCTLIRTSAPSDTCLVTMHPIGGTGWLPIMGTLRVPVFTCWPAIAVIEAPITHLIWKR